MDVTHLGGRLLPNLNRLLVPVGSLFGGRYHAKMLSALFGSWRPYFARGGRLLSYSQITPTTFSGETFSRFAERLGRIGMRFRNAHTYRLATGLWRDLTAQ